MSNQNVAAAVAAYAQAQALVRQQRAALFPSLSLDASATRSGGAGALDRRGSLQLGLGASWEPDLWGKLRLGGCRAREAGAQASAANLAAARLSAQAALATDYFALREADHEIACSTAAVAAYERALRITQNQYAAAIAQRSDVLQAQTQLETTRANLTAMVGQRALLEHAIALLVGKAPAEFAIAGRRPGTRSVPAVPLVVPSSLLQRRPDIAAAERAVAAANAQIGIQRAAYFPSLGAVGVVRRRGLPAWRACSGPRTTSGRSACRRRRRCSTPARSRPASRARRRRATRRSRTTGRRCSAPSRRVEDQLATSRSLAEQEGQRRAASADADRVEQLTLNQYLQGQVAYTAVVTAQVTALNARQTLSQLMSSRQAAAVALIQAMGGGWHAGEADGAAASR